jgi:hypothetical protein
MRLKPENLTQFKTLIPRLRLPFVATLTRDVSMRLNSKILPQFKALTPRLWLPLLAALIVVIVAMLVYSLGGSASDDIVIMLTPPPKLTPTPLAAAAAETPAAVEPEVGVPALPPNGFYLSLAKDSVQTIGSVSEVQDEDILSYDGSDFALVFDGSAAGLAANVDVDAFDFLDTATLLLSFDKPTAIGPLRVDDSDIVKFEATSFGPDNTAGRFSLFFEGAALGLKTSRANVDALTLLPDGMLLISTEGRVKMAGVTGSVRAEAEDILAFVPAAPGDYGSGDWSLYLDGSNTGIRSGRENIDGLAIAPSGEIYLTTTGKFSAAGITGSGEDIFSYTPASPEDITAANFSQTLFFDGSGHGLNRNDVDAISFP